MLHESDDTVSQKKWHMGPTRVGGGGREEEASAPPPSDCFVYFIVDSITFSPLPPSTQP